MKTSILHSKNTAAPQRGSAVLVLLAFLTILLLLCAATARTISWSRQEIRLIEEHQLARLATATNQPPTAAISANSPTP